MMSLCRESPVYVCVFLCVCHLTSVRDLQPSLAADVTGGRAHVVQHVVKQELLVLIALLRLSIQIQLVGRPLPLELSFSSVLSPTPSVSSTPQVREGGGWAVPEKQVAADGGLQAAGELTEFTAIKLHQEGLHQTPRQTLHLPTVQTCTHSPAHHLQSHRTDVTVTLLHCRHHHNITMTSQRTLTEKRTIRFLQRPFSHDQSHTLQPDYPQKPLQINTKISLHK